MAQNKPIIKFIPAGFSLNNLSTSNEAGGKSRNGEHKSEVTNSSNNSRICRITPPKTICKNRSLTQPSLSTNIRNNGAFHSDLQVESISHSLNGNCRLECSKTSILENDTSKTFLEDSDLAEVSQDAPNASNTLESVSQKQRTIVVESDLNEAFLVNHSTPIKETTQANFKTILYERLHKAQLKKQNVNGIIDTKIKHEATEKEKNNYAKVACCCENENCDTFVNCSIWCKHNLDFKNSENSKSSVPFFADSTEKQHYITKTINDKIILQGPVIPRQVSSLNETFLEEEVQMALQSLDCSMPNNIQSYMWLGIQRGLNAVIVAPPKSGKTLSYLPAFCSLSFEKNGKYKELSNYGGPLIIILCENCDQLKNLTKTLLSQTEEILVESITDESCLNVNNCDILITTPPLLEHYLKLGKVKIQRLCHLAIENAHFLLRTYHYSMENLLKIINILQTNRPHNKTIQLVVTSEKWSLDLEFLVKKLNTIPLMCFADFLEAAVYSKTQFKKKKLKTQHKIFYLDDILKTKYMTHKSVVFCDQEGIAKMKEHLELNGIECILISDYYEEDDIFENENMWNYLQTGHYKVLLCTDAVFEKTVKIVGADWLVHYNIPDDEALFQKRFRCLANHFYSPVINNKEENCHQIQPQCFIIFDEAHESELIVNFFETLTRNNCLFANLNCV